MLLEECRHLLKLQQRAVAVAFLHELRELAERAIGGLHDALELSGHLRDRFLPA